MTDLAPSPPQALPPVCNWTLRCAARAGYLVAHRTGPDEVMNRQVCPRHLDVAQALGYHLVTTLPGPTPRR